MNLFDGIKNFLEFVNDNWTAIAVMIGLVLTITGKAVDYFRRSKEEKIEIPFYQRFPIHRPSLPGSTRPSTKPW